MGGDSNSGGYRGQPSEVTDTGRNRPGAAEPHTSHLPQGGGSWRDWWEAATAAIREGIEDIAGEPGEVTDTGGSRLAVAEPRFLI
jgi:hypothetical protein